MKKKQEKVPQNFKNCQYFSSRSSTLKFWWKFLNYLMSFFIAFKTAEWVGLKVLEFLDWCELLESSRKCFEIADWKIMRKSEKLKKAPKAHMIY